MFYTIECTRCLSKNESMKVDYGHLMEASDLLCNFRTYWDQCEQLDNPSEARKQLVSKIVERVFVYDHKVLGLVLFGDFAVLLEENKIAPSEIESAIHSTLTETNVISVEIYSQSGDDGSRLHTCILLLIPPYAITNNPLFNEFIRKIAKERDITSLSSHGFLTQRLHC
jgi:hypothetical protein